jgi:type I restriction enzyme S subunit
LEVQVTIENVLRVQTELIAREREALEKLRLVKQGLMKDLLTGRVRVTRSGELTG